MEKEIDQYWYPISPPWFTGAICGTGILAGSEDPHAATWVADMSGMVYELQELQPMLETEACDHVRELVNHIIETHNNWLDGKRDEFRKSIICPSR